MGGMENAVVLLYFFDSWFLNDIHRDIHAFGGSDDCLDISEHLIFVGEINHTDFRSSKYAVSRTGFRRRRLQFNHSQVITIPHELLLLTTRGAISFGIGIFWQTYEGNWEFSMISRLSVGFLFIDDNNVRLSGGSFRI